MTVGNQLFSFGAGSAFAFRTDIANPTPIKIADLTESSLELSATNKALFGSSQYAIAIGRGECKVTGKLKFARQQLRILSDLFLGVPLTTGQIDTINGEAIVANSTPVVVANGATFLYDNGLINAATGVPLTRVSAAPSTGQYAVNVATGAYTFSAADATANLACLASYGYTIAAAGQQLAITNQQQGVQPVFQLTLVDTFNGPQGLVKATAIVYACVATKFSMAGKTGDFKTPEMDFEAYDPGTGVIAHLSASTQS